MVGGGPREIGTALLDTTDAVLLEGTTVVRVGLPGDRSGDDAPTVGIMMEGRINRSQERSEVLYLFDWDGAAALVSELVALASRAGGADREEFQRCFDARMSALVDEGAL